MVIASIGLSLSRSSTPVRTFDEFNTSRGTSPNKNFPTSTSRGTTPIRSRNSSRGTTPVQTTGSSLKTNPPEQPQTKSNTLPSSRGTTPVRSTGSPIKSNPPEEPQTKSNTLPSSRSTTPVGSLNTNRGTTPIRNTTGTSLKETVPEEVEPKVEPKSPPTNQSSLKSFIKSIKPGQSPLKSVKTKQTSETEQSIPIFATLGKAGSSPRISLPKPSSSKISNPFSQLRSASVGLPPGYLPPGYARRLPCNFEPEEPLPPIFSIFD